MQTYEEQCKRYGYEQYREPSEQGVARADPKIAEQSSCLLNLFVNIG